MVFGMRHTGEKGENPHYHLVVRTKVNAQAFRVRMKKIFDQGKGNGHMSIKPWDGSSDACAYMFHEENAQIVIRKGVSDAQLIEYKARNQHVQAEVEKAKEKASWTIEEEAFNRLKKLDHDWNAPYLDHEFEIMKTIIRVAFDKGK